MSGLVVTVETDRPYFGSWTNYRIKNMIIQKLTLLILMLVETTLFFYDII